MVQVPVGMASVDDDVLRAKQDAAMRVLRFMDEINRVHVSMGGVIACRLGVVCELCMKSR